MDNSRQLGECFFFPSQLKEEQQHFFRHEPHKLI
jgi:hypothetical protein